MASERPLRIVTAVAPYDGHDASVLALNRALLSVPGGVEVIYLGFNMTGEQIAAAAVQEGADAVAVASYNGGHLQFFPHLVRLLADSGSAHVPVYGGGGGTILPADAEAIEGVGVEKIYGPGWPLDAVAADMVDRARKRRSVRPAGERMPEGSFGDIARLLTEVESGASSAISPVNKAEASRVVVFAGGGGGGKSTLIDELLLRYLEAFPQGRVAILANDPTLARGEVHSALLADRVRMNHIYHPRVLMRSVATGSPHAPLSPHLPGMVRVLRAAGVDLIIVETPGTGQVGLDLAPVAPDLAVYLMTREYGAGLQLEKDQLLHAADLVVLNKIDLPGSEAAHQELRSVLGREGREGALHPVMAKFARDPGLDRLFASVCSRMGWPAPDLRPGEDIFVQARRGAVVPHRRRSYLAEIAARVREYDAWAAEQLRRVRRDPVDLASLDPSCARILQEWPARWEALSTQAARKTGGDPWSVTPNGLRLPKVALPDPEDRAEALRFLLEEGLPGEFPYATGIYPLRPLTSGETTRQFAGLRGPEETNRRLHFLSRGVPRPRLSIAFDGITLYGADSDDDPGSVGKIGEGGVSVDSYEDMKLILRGFSIPEISTSMTINGPAPIILAMYFNAALDLEEERREKELGRPLSTVEREETRRETLRTLRGTVQADILKEVQAQNENIFQTDFALRLLGDVQAWFVEQGVKNFYSLSISGYHIGEAGAAPIQELAFTLANGFTYVEYFLARGLPLDDFAPNLSFFFKVSHEAEWLAYGAVCRKIWAIALRDVYRGSERSQKFKFHTQTSGRALQSEEWDTLNPLRQTYHALLGLLANTNSLHVDSADEPMTTPGEKFVRQATMIPNYLREEGEGFVIQNLLSGSYAFRTLMKEVQAGVLEEFERLDQLGGVIPAMEQGYQRRVIADHSARYERERRRPTPENPREPVRRIIGYNAYPLPDGHPEKYPPVPDVVRPNPDDWERQLARVRGFRERHREDGPAYLEKLRQTALSGGNVFAELMETVRHATLGEIVRTLMAVGGKYRKMV